MDLADCQIFQRSVEGGDLMANEVLEKLAELEHEQVAAWMGLLLASIGDDEKLSAERVARYAKFRATPYTWLTEDEKDISRGWAKKVLKIVRDGTSFDVPPPPDANTGSVLWRNLKACLVKSTTDQTKWYIVIASPFVWCSCSSFKFRAPELCKHLIYILADEPSYNPVTVALTEEIARHADDVFGKG